MLDRRTWLAQAGGATLLVLAGRRDSLLALVPKPVIEVYKDPNCGCCNAWVDHLRASGFTANTHDDSNTGAVKDRLGVPDAMRSCHTGKVDGYLVEGHVPAADIHRMLRGKPKFLGLAIPGMPMSAPGMAQPGSPIHSYTVLAFDKSGKTSVYAQYK